MAFFPCIYFCALSQVAINYGYVNYKKLNIRQKTEKILERSANREYFFSLAVKLFCVIQEKNLRMIMENPWSEQTFLKANFVIKPTLVDNDRTLRGDFYVKPTAYWFVGCYPTFGKSFQPAKEKKSVLYSRQSPKAGLCSEERSMIHPDYARNFICDFIIGKEQQHTMRDLFAV